MLRRNIIFTQWIHVIVFFLITISFVFANDDEGEPFGYLYVGGSLSHGMNEGIGSIGFGATIIDSGARYGAEIGVAFPWWRDRETEPLLGFEGRVYWAFGGTVAFIAGVGAILATDLWFDPLADNSEPEAPDDGSGIDGVIALLPSIGIVIPSTTAVQLECSFRPVLGLSTDHGAFARAELSLALRAGGIF